MFLCLIFQVASTSQSNGRSDTTAAEGASAAAVASDSKDNSFRQFRRLCADIAEESSYLEKTKIISTFLKKGSSGSKYCHFSLEVK